MLLDLFLVKLLAQIGPQTYFGCHNEIIGLTIGTLVLNKGTSCFTSYTWVSAFE